MLRGVRSVGTMQPKSGDFDVAARIAGFLMFRGSAVRSIHAQPSKIAKAGAASIWWRRRESKAGQPPLTRGQYEANHALSKHAVTSFVMNDAAIPAEAFDQQYNAQDLSALLVAHATGADGYLPADAVWAAQWLDMQTLNPVALAQWSLTTQSTNYVTQPPPLYQTRWSQVRPAGGVPDAALPNSTPQRGSWLGYFASNIGQIGGITNTFTGGTASSVHLHPGYGCGPKIIQNPIPWEMLTLGLCPPSCPTTKFRNIGPRLHTWMVARSYFGALHAPRQAHANTPTYFANGESWRIGSHPSRMQLANKA